MTQSCDNCNVHALLTPVVGIKPINCCCHTIIICYICAKTRNIREKILRLDREFNNSNCCPCWDNNRRIAPVIYTHKKQGPIVSSFIKKFTCRR